MRISIADNDNFLFLIVELRKKLKDKYKLGLYPTCAPKSDSENENYNRFIILTCRLVSLDTNELVGYFTFRSTDPSKASKGLFNLSSIERFDSNYKSIYKAHLDDYKTLDGLLEDTFRFNS